MRVPRYYLLFSSVLLTISWQPLQAQADDEPVSWNYQVKQINKQRYEVHLTATLENGWYIYSQYSTKEGALPTRIVFDKDIPVSLKGAVQEVGELQTIYKEVLSKVVEYYYHEVVFLQQVDYQGPRPLPISGVITYRVCHKEEGCSPKVKKPFIVMIE